MLYFKAWYRGDRDGAPADDRFPDWVVAADDAAEARARVLAEIGRNEPERGYAIYLVQIDDEDAATIAYASARQNGQALGGLIR